MTIIGFGSFAFAFDVKEPQPTMPYGVFSTLSAETLPKNKFAVNLLVERLYNPDFYRNTTHLAYGLTNHFELAVDASQVLGWQDSKSGFEDVKLACSHRLIDDGKFNPSVSYLLTASLNSGKQEFSSKGGYGGGLILSKKIGPFAAHLNAIYTKPNDTKLREEYRLNLGANMAISHHVNFLAEFTAKRNYFNNDYDLIRWRIGLRAQPSEAVFTSAGFTFGTNNRSADYGLFFAVGLILPKEKKIIQKIIEE